MPSSRTTLRRCTIAVQGVVQGVGFRPLVYRLAVRHALAGSVRNSLQGVVADVQGSDTALADFIDELTRATPAGAGARLSIDWREPRHASTGFVIDPSLADGPADLSPTPDLAACEDCIEDLAVAAGRRHRYALTTCAACGPRFTIVRTLPYDRERTTMAGFDTCPACRGEYADPADRRFHAETISCSRCGPVLEFRDADGRPLATGDPVAAAVDVLARGGIVAVKGIGGYHLACDATSGAAVAELRRRKRREAKPFAVMVRDVDAARALCVVSDAETELLQSPARPIVLLARRPEGPVAAEVAPGRRELGILLPYTPLHHLLLHAMARPLVVTSGNASDEAIAHEDQDAQARLAPMADRFLTHDRPIHVPCDDSVARVMAGVPSLLRRSRGYVPLAITLPVAARRPILACGGELKSTVALVRGRDTFLSQHLGDLGGESAYRGYVRAVEHLEALLGLRPEVMVHDLHPGYRSTAYVHARPAVERIGVQHHHAHVASCLADNGVDRPVIGVAWDGTGLGADGQVWGGEFLVADLAGFERIGHLEMVPLPGGEAAVREPWRMAAAFLAAAYGEAMPGLDLAFVRRLDTTAWRVLSRAAEKGLNAPLTSSAGRLFDAVSSLLGLRDRISFEGEAAMELEAIAALRPDRAYTARLAEDGERLVVRTTDIVRGVVEDLLAGEPAPIIAARFHGGLTGVIVDVCGRVRARTAIGAVALSGGVFQNRWLLEATVSGLRAEGFEVYTHRQVPPNDGGLALGQAAVAARRLAAGGG